MDYEKKYKEALERAKNVHKDAIDMDESIRAKQCEIIFPELKESEDDKARKELYDFCIKCSRGEIVVNQQTDYQRWAAWLEKQKPTTNLQNLTWEDIEKIGEFINMVQYENPNGIGAKCLYTDVLERFLDGKQIKQKPQRMVSGEAKEALYDKPTWSEDDENNLTQLHELIVKDETLWGKHAILDNWLKSLKGRVQPQWKPSEEQIKDFGGALLILKLQHYVSSESLESLYEQLKKL